MIPRENNDRVVLTLDAGGTKFAFMAVQHGRAIVGPLTQPAEPTDLDACLHAIVAGLEEMRRQAPVAPIAISLAFPGPADYPRGIIGDLGNLPAFRGGVALGPMLEDHFGLPTFINNDGDLFALGEATGGLLPYVNSLLEKAGSPKRYRNLLGVTLGTGLGGGIVHDGRLFTGDNSAAGEIWLLRHKGNHNLNAEEGASIRGVKRAFSKAARVMSDECPEPHEIFAIATGERAGDRQAALSAFQQFGEVAGDAVANALTLVDGIVAIGGGLSEAHSLFLPALVAELNRPFDKPDGSRTGRLETRAYNLEDANELADFLTGQVRTVQVPGSARTIRHDALPRVGVGVSLLGTSTAVCLGAYVFALDAIGSRSRSSEPASSIA